MWDVLAPCMRQSACPVRAPEREPGRRLERACPAPRGFRSSPGTWSGAAAASARPLSAQQARGRDRGGGRGAGRPRGRTGAQRRCFRPLHRRRPRAHAGLWPASRLLRGFLETSSKPTWALNKGVQRRGRGLVAHPWPPHGRHTAGRAGPMPGGPLGASQVPSRRASAVHTEPASTSGRAPKAGRNSYCV